ncbi:hypothetical protein [Flavobacterium aciduliphilum]|uniref:Uncharacterized protein n=1 Tax=Flavobacterium aciduliphilum TaxID=1101402 RepID=A0A328YNN2_9FLAO|nr:hypothetical protein [Flavobacterium aciduliphilum]RAR73762.1 hypothetical protein CLV55_10381 [Flavobacterium aciduliphilum]
MNAFEEKEVIKSKFKDASDEELLTNIRISKLFYILFSRNFYRILVFSFSMLINLYFYHKIGNEIRLINNSVIALVISIFITNYLNSDKEAETEKQTIKILRKMREELKEKRKYE